MRKYSAVAGLLVFLVMLPGLTAADSDLDDVSNMNCGDQIAEIGDQQFEFQQKCGPPTATEENGQVWIRQSGKGTIPIPGGTLALQEQVEIVKSCPMVPLGA